MRRNGIFYRPKEHPSVVHVRSGSVIPGIYEWKYKANHFSTACLIAIKNNMFSKTKQLTLLIFFKQLMKEMLFESLYWITEACGTTSSLKGWVCRCGLIRLDRQWPTTHQFSTDPNSDVAKFWLVQKGTSHHFTSLPPARPSPLQTQYREKKKEKYITKIVGCHY